MASVEDEELEEGEILSDEEKDDKKRYSSSKSRNNKRKIHNDSCNYKSKIYHKEKIPKSPYYVPKPPPSQKLRYAPHYPLPSVSPSTSRPSNVLNIRMKEAPSSSYTSFEENLPHNNAELYPNNNVNSYPVETSFYSPSSFSNNIEIIPEQYDFNQIDPVQPEPFLDNRYQGNTEPLPPVVTTNSNFCEDKLPKECLFDYNGAKYQVLDSYEESPKKKYRPSNSFSPPIIPPPPTEPQLNQDTELTIPLIININQNNSLSKLKETEPNNDSQLSFLNLFDQEPSTDCENSNELTNLNPSIDSMDNGDWEALIPPISSMESNNSESDFEEPRTSSANVSTGPSSIDIEAKKLALIKEFKCDLSSINNVGLMLAGVNPSIKSQLRASIVSTVADLRVKYYNRLKEYIEGTHQ